MLDVLGKSTSINVRKVLWLLQVLGLDYRHLGADGSHSSDAAALQSRNPNGLVPVIRDGDFVLWESNSICRYLAARAQRDDLLPQEAQARARVEQWMDWQATDLNTAWRYVFMSRVRQHPGYSDEAAAEASLSQWNRLMQQLDQRLADTGAYVTGPVFTLADIVLGLSAQRWFMTPGEKPDLPAVQAWFERLAGHAGFDQHCRNGIP